MRNNYDNLEEVVKECYSIADVCRKYGVKPCGGNYLVLKNKIKKLGISTNHFSGQSWRKGSKAPVKDAYSMEIVLTKNFYYNSNRLRKRLISEGYKLHMCEICNNSTWNNNPIPLELDHINGDNMDNRIENLRIVCPNCHAQTPTYRGKNKLSALSEKRGVEYRKFREGLTANPEPSPKREGAETRHGTPKSKDKVKG
jgi:hypothetical protein